MSEIVSSFYEDACEYYSVIYLFSLNKSKLIKDFLR